MAWDATHLAYLFEGNCGILYNRIGGQGLLVKPPLSLLLDCIAPFERNSGPVQHILQAHGINCHSLQHSPSDDARLTQSDIASGKYTRQLSLMVTLECNYSCRDCFVYNEDSNTHYLGSKQMTKEIAQNALAQFYQIRKPFRERNLIRFFGGEPLINWPLIEYLVPIIAEEHPEDTIILTTNGSLLTQKRAQFLTKFRVITHVSLNGTQEQNDVTRPDKLGRSTFAMSKKAVELLLEAGSAPHISVTLFNRESFYAIPEFISMLKAMRANSCIPLYLYLSLLKGKVQETDLGTEGEALASFVSHLWIEELQHNVMLGGKLFHALINLFREPSNFLRWCERGTGIVVYPGGDLRPCSGSDIVIGHADNLHAALESVQFRQVSSRIGGQIRGCQGCSIEGMCGGSCACSSGGTLETFQPGLNCDFERRLFDRLAKVLLRTFQTNPSVLQKWISFSASSTN